MNKRASGSGTWGMLWKTIILTIALLVNISLGLRLMWGPQSLVSYHELKAQHTALLQKLAEQDTDNAGLSREIRLLQTDERYVEKMIRQRLNYVKENEILYLFDSDQQTNGMGAVKHEGKN